MQQLYIQCLVCAVKGTTCAQQVVETEKSKILVFPLKSFPRQVFDYPSATTSQLEQSSFTQLNSRSEHTTVTTNTTVLNTE